MQEVECVRIRNMARKDKVILRTAFILVGLVVAYLSYYYMSVSVNKGVLIQFLGMGLILWGCYLWTSLKNRHWLFILWGLLSPIGLIGIALLKDKSVNAKTKDDTFSAGK